MIYSLCHILFFGQSKFSDVVGFCRFARANAPHHDALSKQKNRRPLSASIETAMYTVQNNKRKIAEINGQGPLAVSHNEQVRLRPPLSSASQADGELAATQSLLSLAEAASNESKTKEEKTTADASIFVSADTNVNNERGGNNDSMSLWGVAIEYAAGVELRTHVLEPVLADFPNASQSETTRLLGMNSRGELLLVTDSEGRVQQASMERIRTQDEAMFANWWDTGDKFLPFTDQTWSDWWIRRCHLFDPGCEMYKLVTRGGETLGVVYFERNIVDHHEFGDKGRIALIRGMRVAPSVNPEVTQRKSLAAEGTENDNAGAAHKRIISLLVTHVLYMSVRYGSNAVGVNCPKIPETERFYQSFMGDPLAFDESGRRYYRLRSEGRWKALCEAFHQQVQLWPKQPSNTATTGQPEDDS